MVSALTLAGQAYVPVVPVEYVQKVTKPTPDRLYKKERHALYILYSEQAGKTFKSSRSSRKEREVGQSEQSTSKRSLQDTDSGIVRTWACPAISRRYAGSSHRDKHGANRYSFNLSAGCLGCRYGHRRSRAAAIPDTRIIHIRVHWICVLYFPRSYGTRIDELERY